MNFPQIQISTKDIKLDMNIHKPTQRIHQEKADLKIEQPAAVISMDSTPAQLLIDQSKAWRDMGLLTTKESIQKYAQDGKQATLKNIAKVAREGRQMMENAGKGQGHLIIKNIVKQNHTPKIAPINIKFIPSIGAVDIKYIPEKLDINVSTQKPKIDAQINKPIHEYTPGKVTHDVIQYPSVNIDVIR